MSLEPLDVVAQAFPVCFMGRDVVRLGLQLPMLAFEVGLLTHQGEVLIIDGGIVAHR